MKETMKYNINKYQLREFALTKILDIIHKQATTAKHQPLFFGDSLIEGIPSQYPILNHGISGMSSEMLEHLLDELVIKFEPSHVFLHIGINDLATTTLASPRDIAWNIVRIMLILNQCLPNTKLYVISTLPCIDELSSFKQTGKGIRCNDMVNVLNEEIQEHIVHTQAKFIDLNSKLYNDDKSLKQVYYRDGMHLNDEGYHYLAQYFTQ
ncbi:GDSL-type esterase/lipase family protein [Erysipelothrix urinaevulpis]|uniref:GDSL-type esterase/lipase family protein n=1 Tax=Erysipelothrix urinaevulpis TaxID=2683717 RepID=UPI00135CDC4B|nr:GDSL-type esterase/lipase family protein [Erysipelothrix urinaevulpis]